MTAVRSAGNVAPVKTLILSDLHLGHPSSRLDPAGLEALGRLASRFDRVILNGDALDRWERPDPTPEMQAWRARLERTLVAREGPAELLTGNHDPAISERHYCYLEEAQALVFHGDYVLDCASPWMWHAGVFKQTFRAAWSEAGGGDHFARRAEVFRRVQRAFLSAHPEDYAKEALRPGPYLLRQMLSPRRAVRIAHYLVRMPAWVARRAAGFDRPVTRAVVGHSHRAGVWRVGALEVCNTGSFMPFSQPWGLVVEGASARREPVAALLDGLGRAVAVSAAGLEGTHPVR
ncbi:MAG: hypothetical protein AMXMBFR7_10780 [Planctomycetota bacterium]